jgi:hypothetical protein
MEIQGLILIFFWTILWIMGGLLIIANLFVTTENETFFLGAATGLVLENWLANLLSQIINPLIGFWLAPGLVLLAGVLLEYKLKYFRKLQIKNIFITTSTFWFIAALVLFSLIGRGLPIFDDFQNLPTVSRLAAGDIAPHFPLNPEIRFGYHYFLSLVAAQITRIGGLFPAAALDVTRAFFMVATVFLGGKFILRMTQSRIAEMLGMIFLLFSSGIRWLLLLVPPVIQNILNSQIHLIGTGADTGNSLFEAIYKPWMIEAGPIPFPFTFASGINPPLILSLGGIGASAVMIIMLILMTFQSRRRWYSLIVIGIFVAALALADEVWFVLFGAGLVLCGLSLFWKKDTLWRMEVLSLALPAFAGALVALFQGGMITEKFISILNVQTASNSYFDTTVKFIFPPALVSGHLGILYVNNIYQLFIGLVEIGPIILIAPSIIVFMIAGFRSNKITQVILGGSALISLLTVFLLYQGSGGVSGTTRLLESFLFTCTLIAVPYLWSIAQKGNTILKTMIIAVYGASIISGVVIFAISLAGISRPTNGELTDAMDLQIFNETWNKLPENSLVFDALPERAVTIFGRATKSSPNWFNDSPEWLTLRQDPSPSKLRGAGFDYAYFDLQDWEKLSPATKAEYKSDCAVLLKKIQIDDRGRRLYQITDCIQY